MSTGLGRFNNKHAKIRYLQKKADKKNKEMGYNDDYYETFDNFDPVVIPKREPLFREQDRVDKLPFEMAGNVEPRFGPLNIGLRKKGKVTEEMDRSAKMGQFYSTISGNFSIFEFFRRFGTLEARLDGICLGSWVNVL